MTALLNEIKKLGPTYAGLEAVVDSHLASPVNANQGVRQSMREHLGRHWFSDDGYFHGQHMAKKWAEAVMKTLELSLAGSPNPVPINSWWIIQGDENVRMLNLAEVDQKGATVGSSVTLLVCTPMPPPSGAPGGRSLWGNAEAWVTETERGGVVTRRIDKEPRPGR
jgi:hypothetical protein